MKLEFPIGNDLGLKIASGQDRSSPFPTSKIQKGFVLIYQGLDLSEEAVGFGVPIVKRGLRTIFPREVDLYLHGGKGHARVSARYKLNLEERLVRNGNASVKSKLLYAGKNGLAAMIRRIPIMRKPLTDISNLLRSRLAWQTTYEPSDFSTYMVLSYTIDELEGSVMVDLVGGDFLSAGVSEVVVMNELGGHHFDQYQDSRGICLTGEEIGCWDQVEAQDASFIDQSHKIVFSLQQAAGARLYRGRELIEPRLAWSGFGYSLAPGNQGFQYAITFKRSHE
jgi:hypothetical protein